MPIIECKTCGKEFHIWNYEINYRKHCSRKCRETKEVVICKICGNSFSVVPSKIKKGKGVYCSKKCYALSKKGQVPWNKGVSRKINNALEIWRANGGTNKGCVNWNKGGHLTNEWKDKIGESNKGKIRTDENRKKISKTLTGKYVGEKAYQWKGENVGYCALHIWVKKHLGQPTKCEHCEKDGLTGHQIHWANKSGEYKRDLTDWLRLCVKCHRKYDLTHPVLNRKL